MKRQVTVLSLLLGGLFLLGLGLGWTRLVPSSAYWGEDQAREYAAAQADLHAKSHLHERSGEPKAEFTAARTRYENIRQQLERAQNSRSFTGTMLTAAGMLALISGIGIHLAGRRSG